AINYVYELRRQEDALRAEAEDLRQQAEEKRYKRRKQRVWIPLVCLIPTMFVIYLLYGIIFNIIREICSPETVRVIAKAIYNMYMSGWWVLLLAVQAWLLVFCITFALPNKEKKYLAQAETIDTYVVLKRDEIDNFVVAHANHISMVASKYRYPTASNFLVELFELGRASSLPEAYDKLEEQLHRWRMEDAMLTLINLQRRQLALLERIETNPY
ncbi:MAG: hypothetical protein IJW65_05770, partial [Clostridia bacterium]|nr:hypothetical protein [Clostridia bacterium]